MSVSLPTVKRFLDYMVSCYNHDGNGGYPELIREVIKLKERAAKRKQISDDNSRERAAKHKAPQIYDDSVESDDDSEERSGDEQDNEGTEWGERSPLLSFSNTDMAFSDDVLIVGNYHGFNVYKLAEDGAPELFSSIVCPGGQGDVSIVRSGKRS